MDAPSMYRFALVGLLALIGAGCASQVPPSGGPPDTQPPEIISTIPADGELNYQGKMFVIRFSEYVDRRSFQETTFLSPSAGALGFEWSGTEVQIIPSDTLRAGTTFILTVGTDLKDSRNNNLARSFTLAFSTGGVIDSCSVSGRVYAESPGGVMIYAYALPAEGPDTLNPAASAPDYLTQTGADGTYRLTNLKYGRYRVMAVRDVFKNLLYNIHTDMYGMPSSDVRLSPAAREVRDMPFRLSTEDTLRPYLTAGRALDRERVAVRFNEKPDRRGLREVISVTDTLDGSELEIVDFSPADTTGREFHMVTAPQDSGAVYRLTLRELRDPAGNIADSAGRTINFTGSAERDTLPPVLTFSVRGDSATGILPRTPLTISFSRAVDTVRMSRGFSVKRGGTDSVPGRLHWEGAMLARFDPEVPPVPGAWYEAGIAAGSFRDVRGKVLSDTAIVKRFRITEEKFLGSIEGSVVPPAGRDTLPDASMVVVVARKLPGPETGGISVGADRDGTFIIDRIPEGRYIVSGFLDVNGNRAFDNGSTHPAIFAEQFFVYPDTLKIRPGWPVGGVRLQLGK
jgi:uncharacterized protein (DUF2141 family)